MFSEALYLPFSVSNFWYGAYGVMRLEPHALALEFQLIDRWLGCWRSGIRTVYVPYVSFHAAERQQQRWKRQFLVLKSASLHPFRAIPGALQGQCWLQIPVQASAELELFLNQLQLKLSSSQLEQLQLGTHLSRQFDPYTLTRSLK